MNTLCDEMENASDFKIVDSNPIEINQIDLSSEKYNKFHKKKKKKHKHKLRDEMENASDCKIVDSNSIEINQIDSSSEKVNRFHEKKKKKHKHKLCDEMENASDCKIVDSNVIEINQTDSNIEDYNKFHKKKKKKRKHKLCDEMENVYCKIEDSNPIEINQIDSSSEKVNRFHEKKKKKHKHKLRDEMENASDCKIVDSNSNEINQIDSSSEKVNRFHEKKKKKHKHKLCDEMENASDCKIVDSNVIEINQTDSNIEDYNKFHKKKKKKHKHKLCDEMENVYCKIEDSNPIEINQIDSSSEKVNRFHEKKKKKHKHKLCDEMENASDCKIVDSNVIEINQTDSNIEDYNKFHKKKKNEHKLPVETETMSACNAADSNAIEINQSNKFHEQKKKKVKHKLPDEMETISVSNAADSNAIEINQNGLNIKTFNKFHKKKNEHKLFNEMGNIFSDNIKKSAMDELENNRIYNDPDVQKRNKRKISDYKTIDSNANAISTEHRTFNGLHKAKRKKCNMSKVESFPKTFIELNNPSNDIYLEHTKEEKQNVSGITSEKNYQGVKDSYMSFDPFMHNMAVQPVSFPVPLLHADETTASITPEKKEYLEKEGITIHTGKWTKTEDNILTRNFQQFGLKFRVNNPFQLLGINQYKTDDEIVKFKRAKHFLVRLGKGLDNRSLRSIYMRARKILDPLKNEEKLSTDEAAELKHAHELVGNKWTRISDMLSRSANTCQTAYRWHKSDINKGKWTPEETSNLIKAIKTVTGEEDISADKLKNISWKAVAKYVPTRNEFQCHKQWAGHLAWNSSVTVKKTWSSYHLGKLIYLLREKYCFNSEYEIDWRELHKHFIDVAPSYIFLRKKWLYLKGRLPKEMCLSYNKCLNALKKMYEDQYKMYADEKV